MIPQLSVASRNPDAVAQFVERFAAVLGEAGFPTMAARVFVAVLASDSGGLTSAELTEQLQISPAAVSSAVRHLIQVNLASRERLPGSRREVYRVYLDDWYEVVMHRLQSMSAWTKPLRDGVEALDPQTPAGSRISETLEFFLFLEKRLSVIMDEWREHHTADDDGGRVVGAPAASHPR